MSTDYTVHEESYKGHVIRIERDTDAESPRNWDNAGTMVCWHTRYDLGDKSGHEFANDMPASWDGEVSDSPEGFIEWAAANKAVYIPLYLYDHSGITMRTSAFGDRWDSGQVGYIYILPETIHKEWGHGPAAYRKARVCLESEVLTYDDYLTGQVFGYVINDGKDSCWGFYPDHAPNVPDYQYCLAEARAIVDYQKSAASK